MFEDVKTEVVGDLVPEYIKWLNGVGDWESFQQATEGFITVLASRALPTKKVIIRDK